MQSELMEISTFTELTGIEFITEEEIRSFNRALRRASRTLERYLGWSPIYRQMYTEVAVVNGGVGCPSEEQLAAWRRRPSDSDLFHKPTSAVGQIKLFPYYPEDANYYIDPCTAVHSVKLVKILSGDDQEFMTVLEMQPDDWNQKVNNSFIVNRNPVIQWIEICSTPTTLPCRCDEGKSCYMLAVDADWLRILNDDLLDFLSDLVLWHLQNSPSLEPRQLLNSESVDGHSVTYNNDMVKKSEDEVVQPWLAVLKHYIGPYSSIYANRLRIS